MSDFEQANQFPPQQEGRRVAARTRTLLGGVLVSRDCAKTWDCTAKNVSEKGAQIRMAVDEPVPDECIFLNLRDATAHNAIIRWRTHPAYGLTFLDSWSLKDANHGPYKFLKQLWAERRARS
jgi:hypothetical protein